MCIVKPDAVLAGLTDRVLGAAEDDGFYVVRRAEKRLTPARARAFYQHLEGTNAFRPAAEFLASGPVVVAVLSKVDAVRAWRERVGPTDPDVARELHPKSIRAQLGVDALRNVAHASATVKDAAREKAFLFPSGPLPGLVPKEYLLETLVMPGLVEALGELYVAQPKDPYAWMAHWFATNDPRPRRSPRSGRRRACVRRTRWRRLRAPRAATCVPSSARPCTTARGTSAGARTATRCTASAPATWTARAPS